MGSHFKCLFDDVGRYVSKIWVEGRKIVWSLMNGVIKTKTGSMIIGCKRMGGVDARFYDIIKIIGWRRIV